MKSRRATVVIGTRPEAVKMAPVIRALRSLPRVETRVVVTGQHRSLLDGALGSFDLAPDIDLQVMRADQSLNELLARTTSAVGRELEEQPPDLVLAQGDTTSVLAAALASFHLHVPFGHVEAGLRTHDLGEPFPEEMNRRMVSALARLHFAPTEESAANLRAEGVAEEHIHVTGNPGVDALLWTQRRLAQTDSEWSSERRLLLVTAHRRENQGEKMSVICAALRDIARRGDVEILFPVHPNPKVRQQVHQLLGSCDGVRLTEPLDYPAMVSAIQACEFLLTDSGGLQEEAPSLNKPVLVLRNTTERPEAVAAGATRIVGTKREGILDAVTQLLEDQDVYQKMSSASNPFGDGEAAPRIAAACDKLLSRRRES